MQNRRLRKIYASYEKIINMFFVQFDEVFSMKNFGQHLLTLVLPKWPNPSKNGLKIGRNHDMTTVNGRGFCFEVPGPHIWSRWSPRCVFDPPQTVGSYLQHPWRNRILNIAGNQDFGPFFRQIWGFT